MAEEGPMEAMSDERPDVKNAGIPRGTLLPFLELESVPDGRRVALRGGRGPRVMHLTHPGGCEACAAYSRGLAASAASLAEWGARVVVVIGDSTPAPAGSVTNAVVLSDPEGKLASRLGLRGAALIIADEWGEIYFAAEAGTGHGLPAPEEVVEWARFVSIQCPECEQPEGDWRTVG